MFPSVASLISSQRTIHMFCISPFTVVLPVVTATVCPVLTDHLTATASDHAQASVVLPGARIFSAEVSPLKRAIMV
jgi:hypothetical protein